MTDLSQHPKYIEALSWCPDNIQQVTLCIQVYLDLCEVRGWLNANTHHCHDLNLVFISGRPGKGKEMELVLPTSAQSELSLEDFSQYFSCVKLINVNTNGIILAICDTDSTTVYYKIFPGLVPPDTPEVAEQKRRERHENFQRLKNDIPKYIEQFTRDSQ